MRSFFELVGYEYKKIFKRKGSVIAILIMIVVAVLSPAGILIGNYYVDGKVYESHYEGMTKDRGYARALAGRPIDEILLTEAKNAYSKGSGSGSYETRPEYEEYGRPYSAINYLVNRIYDDSNSVQSLTPEQMSGLYTTRHERVARSISKVNSSPKAKDMVILLDSKIETPFTFDYTEGYRRYFVIMFSTGVISLFCMAICIAPLFAGEYSGNTDQLLLSSKYGRSKLVYAKLFTGVSFGIAGSVLIMILTYASCWFLFGMDGANAPIQLILMLCPYPLTIFNAACIFSAYALLASLILAAATMALSSKLKSPFGVIIIISAILYLPMIFNLQPSNTLLVILASLMPVYMMLNEIVFSAFPFDLFGLVVSPFILLPIVAMLLSCILMNFARIFFKNHYIR